MQNIRSRLREEGLTDQAASLFLDSWRPSTQGPYNCYIKKWQCYAKSQQINELEPTPVEFSNFLAHLFDQNASYSAVSVARSAIGAFLSPHNHGKSIGSHPIVCRVVKGIFERRPALPKYQETWSVDVVLDCIAGWPDVPDLSLKLLTLRTVMLLCLLTGQRGQALHSLNVKDIHLQSQKCTFVFSEKHKHTRPGIHTEPATVVAFPTNERLCLVTHLRTYLEKTQELRKDCEKLFISFIQPHEAVSRDTFSRWVKTVLEEAGIDTKRYGSHSTRAASTSAAASKGVPLCTIMKAAGWSSKHTFAKFYNKSTDKNFGQSVLDKFVQKC